MKKEPTYKEKVFTYLDAMDVCTKDLKDLCKPETKEQFIKVVKEYIDKGAINGYEIIFSNDFLRIKKFDVILRSSIEKFKESI